MQVLVLPPNESRSNFVSFAPALIYRNDTKTEEDIGCMPGSRMQ
jgi:hypothetical protein